MGTVQLLLILIYVSICFVVFIAFRIPVNQWSLATATLGGIIGITLLLLIMNYNHPFTTNARIYFAVTPLLPSVKGCVIEVPVQANKPLKEGDELFRIDPKPYEYVVDQKKAALAEAEQNVMQLKASLDQSTAQARRANAQFELAQQNYDRQAELFEKNVIAHAARDQELGAAFQQNSLQRVRAGDEAEVAIDAVPGRVFKGSVRLVMEAIAAGQFQPTGGLVDVGSRTEGGRALTIIDVKDDLRLSDPARRGGPGRDLYRTLAPRLADSQNLAAHAQLAELHLPRGALRWFKPYRRNESPSSADIKSVLKAKLPNCELEMGRA
jgi:multidrug efflux pump subunit AcrA (membrane-fusion protein)